MSLDIASLLVFIAVIAVAFFRKNNIGILALGTGVIAVRLFGLSDRDLLGAISVSLFTTLVGITLLFAVITKTGALELLAKKIVALAGRRVWLIPIMLFIAGFSIVACGPGGVPALAIVPPLAVAIALQVGYNPTMLALIGISGMTTGRFSGITPESAIILNAISTSGFRGNISLTITVNLFITNAIIALALYLIYGGYKVKAPLEPISASGLEKFTPRQVVALLSILAMLFLIIVAGVNIGLAAFLVATALLLFHVADDAECIKAIPWSTVVMVLGVGALLSIVAKTGGIKLLNDALASLMTSSTAAPFMGLSAGLLSLVSSALGVVYPTMMPMCVELANQVGGVNPAALMSAVAAGGALSGISPMSTGGALILAAIFGEGAIPYSKEAENGVFVQLLVAAAANLVLLLIVSALFYNSIANVFCPMG